jgi:hypothetical protein
MAENIQRSTGRAQNYKLDRGGQPAEGGPFVGTVVNNIDNTRQGRLQVSIQEFSGTNKDGSANLQDKSQWRTVSYCPPFYGATPLTSGTSAGTGTYPGNRNTYGMWFTPPDLGVQVLCFFVNGDPNQGYYVGCIPAPGQNHMVPAIGATANYMVAEGNKDQETYFANSKLLPVAEINVKNDAIADNPKFFDQKKPVHSFAAAVLFQQGLQDDPVRGSIGSSSQRESPSSCYGISTPGRAIYQGGATEQNIKTKLNDSATQTASFAVIGRRTGHTFVMDDGNLEGADNLIRIRTGKGHQITMSDDGNCFYICHANGQTWVELGQEGTLDVFSTNSINLRTEGVLNLHADKDINMYAGEKINIKSKKELSIQSEDQLSIACKQAMTLFSESKLGLKSNTQFAVKSKTTTIDGGTTLSLKATLISLNGGPTVGVDAPKGLTKYVMPDTSFNNSTGWAVAADGLESIVTRAPTHEPWPYHNQGVSVQVDLENGQPTPPPGAPPMPEGTKITMTGADAAKVAELKTNLANYKASLVGDEEFRAKIIAEGANVGQNASFLAQVDQIIADRKKIIAITEQQIATLERLGSR